MKLLTLFKILLTCKWNIFYLHKQQETLGNTISDMKIRAIKYFRWTFLSYDKKETHLSLFLWLELEFKLDDKESKHSMHICHFASVPIIQRLIECSCT